MIRKLRMKMILASMLSLLAVLLVILSAAGMLDYRRIVSDADRVISILVENDGRFPMERPPENGAFFPVRRPGDERRFSVELPYESRYFSVFFAEDGSVAAVNTGKVAAVDDESAVDYAMSALKSGNDRGFEDNYRYRVYETGGERHVIFLDCGRETGSFKGFLFTIAAVSGAGLLAVLLLLFFLSARIVKPFSENYEKQKRFITDAGHELKTPLTIIDADADVLEMDMGKNEWLSDIRLQTKRLAELTNSLIQLSRTEEQPQTEMIEFPLSDLVEETAEGFKTLAGTQGKDFITHIEPMLSVTGDEKAIGQLISILIDNAVKYSDDGGRIEVTLEKQKSTVKLSVFNTAPYVSAASLPQLFDRFYRADSSRNSGTGSYGLGLSIAAAITAAHKGKISASTKDERSLLIVVTLPGASI